LKQSAANCELNSCLGKELIAMAWLKEKKGPVDMDEFKDIDEDALVEALSPEELADLNAAIDPEVGSEET